MNQRGYSNADVAMFVGCGRTFISALVNGRRTSCKPATAERIALCLSVPLEVLFVAKVSAGGGSSITRQRKAVPAA